MMAEDLFKLAMLDLSGLHRCFVFLAARKNDRLSLDLAKKQPARLAKTSDDLEDR